MQKDIKGTILNLEGQEFYLRYTLNSMRMLEKTYGIKIDKLSEEMDLSMVQALLHVGMRKHHPELSFEEVGDLVDMSTINETVEKISEALGGLKK